MTTDLNASILQMVPQAHPFRFLDRILEVDENRIVSEYTYDPALPFYAATDVTPETILIETVAQSVVVALGLYMIKLDEQRGKGLDPSQYITLFTDVEMEFLLPVKAGETVRVHGEKQSWRFKKIRSKAEVYNEKGELVARGILSGMGVKKQ